MDLAELPPEQIICQQSAGCELTENVRVVFRERQCLQYTIRNVKLIITEALDNGIEAGTNNILLYFAQAPEGRLEEPGPFRQAQIPVIFKPPSTREPDGAILQVEDAEFVRPRLVLEP